MALVHHCLNEKPMSLFNEVKILAKKHHFRKRMGLEVLHISLTNDISTISIVAFYIIIHI